MKLINRFDVYYYCNDWLTMTFLLTTLQTALQQSRPCPAIFLGLQINLFPENDLTADLKKLAKHQTKISSFSYMKFRSLTHLTLLLFSNFRPTWWKKHAVQCPPYLSISCDHMTWALYRLTLGKATPCEWSLGVHIKCSDDAFVTSDHSHGRIAQTPGV